MKPFLNIAGAVGLFWLGAVAFHAISTKAQTPAAYTMSGAAAHTTCTTPVAGSYFLCVATDGIWVSNSGGAYFQIVPPAAQTAGVTSWNGLTGAVTYSAPTPPVSSVNGKTGAVTIAATTTLQ